MYIWYVHLYPELQFQLSCTINSHQVSIVATEEKTAFALKRTNPEQMGCSAPLTKAQGLSPDDQDSHSSRDSVRCRKARLQTSNYLALGKSLSSFLAWLYLGEKKWAVEEMCLYFERQRIAKIECHFNEFSRWDTASFIKIIGWLATLEWPALAILFIPLLLDTRKAPAAAVVE